MRAKLDEGNADEEKGPGRKVVSTDYALAMQVANWLRTQPNDPLPKYKLNYPSDHKGTQYVTLVPSKINKDESRTKRPYEYLTIHVIAAALNAD